MMQSSRLPLSIERYSIYLNLFFLQFYSFFRTSFLGLPLLLGWLLATFSDCFEVTSSIEELLEISEVEFSAVSWLDGSEFLCVLLHAVSLTIESSVERLEDEVLGVAIGFAGFDPDDDMLASRGDALALYWLSVLLCWLVWGQGIAFDAEGEPLL